MPLIGQFAIFAFPLLMIVAAAGDVMTRRISNLLILTIALAFPPAAWAAGMPVWMVLEHGATALVLLGLGFGFFSLGVLGGGDAKLMAVAGLWLGFPPTVVFLVATALAGGVLAAAVGVFFLLQIELGSWLKATAPARLAPSVPYGYAVAAGAIMAIPYSWLLPPALVHG